MKQWIIWQPIINHALIQYNYSYELKSKNLLSFYQLQFNVSANEDRNLSLEVTIGITGELKSISPVLFRKPKKDFRSKILTKVPENMDSLINIMKEMCELEGIPTFDENILHHMSKYLDFNKNTGGLKRILRHINNKEWDIALRIGNYYQTQLIDEPIWQLALNLYKKCLKRNNHSKNSNSKDEITEFFFNTLFLIAKSNIYFYQANKILQEIYRLYNSSLYSEKEILYKEYKLYYAYNKTINDDSFYFFYKKLMMAKKKQESGYPDLIVELAEKFINKENFKIAEIIVRNIREDNPGYNKSCLDLWLLFMKKIQQDVDSNNISFKQGLENKFEEIVKWCKKVELPDLKIERLNISISLLYPIPYLSRILSDNIDQSPYLIKVSECEPNELPQLYQPYSKKKAVISPEVRSL